MIAVILQSERRIKTMNITLKFRSTICTEETYPNSFEVTFVRNLKVNIDEYQDENKLSDIIYNSAHEFEETITTKLHLVSCTTECLGITWISDAKFCELSDLARLGLERI